MGMSETIGQSMNSLHFLFLQCGEILFASPSGKQIFEKRTKRTQINLNLVMALTFNEFRARAKFSTCGWVGHSDFSYWVYSGEDIDTVVSGLH